MLESVLIDPQLQMRVVVGPRKARIDAAGLYRFTSDTASVIEGLLRLEVQPGKVEYPIAKGRHIAARSDSYAMFELAARQPQNDLDYWSAHRSYQLATANLMGRFGDSRPNFFLFFSRSPSKAAWIYSPWLDGFTLMPLQRYQSYYNETFVPLSGYLPPPAMIPPFNVCENATAFDARCRPPNNQPTLPREPRVPSTGVKEMLCLVPGVLGPGV